MAHFGRIDRSHLESIGFSVVGRPKQPRRNFAACPIDRCCGRQIGPDRRHSAMLDKAIEPNRRKPGWSRQEQPHLTGEGPWTGRWRPSPLAGCPGQGRRRDSRQRRRSRRGRGNACDQAPSRWRSSSAESPACSARSPPAGARRPPPSGRRRAGPSRRWPCETCRCWRSRRWSSRIRATGRGGGSPAAAASPDDPLPRL
jgi:hypothetical protein